MIRFKLDSLTFDCSWRLNPASAISLRKAVILGERKSTKSWGLFLRDLNQLYCFCWIEISTCGFLQTRVPWDLLIGHDQFLVTGGNNTEISPFKRGVFGCLLDLALPFFHTYLHIAFVYLVVEFFHPHEATSGGFSISMCEISLTTSGSLRENVIFHELRERDSEFHPFDGFNHHGEKVTT